MWGTQGAGASHSWGTQGAGDSHMWELRGQVTATCGEVRESIIVNRYRSVSRSDR